MTNKPRVIKDFERLDESIQEQIKLKYPLGFSRHLIHFTNQEGKKVSALPFETEEKYYLVRMTEPQARSIIEADEDYNEDGILKKRVKAMYEDRYSDEEGDDIDDDLDDDLDLDDLADEVEDVDVDDD